MILCLVFSVIYFPSRPRYAPTASSVTARLDIKEGVKILLKRGNFWLAVLMFSLTTGTFNGYGLTLDTIVTKCGISQAEAGYIGFAALLSCVPANLIIGGLGGMFPRRKKIMTIVFLVTGTSSMTVFVAQLENWLPRNMAVVWVTVIVGVMCLTGAAPLFFDMSAESSHPVSEDLSSTVMVLGNQLMSLFFIALIQIPHLVDEEHRDKLNYVLIGSFALSVVFSTLYRPTNVREQIDANSVTVDQLDYRSFQQVENAGYSIEVSCD